MIPLTILLLVVVGLVVVVVTMSRPAPLVVTPDGPPAVSRIEARLKGAAR